jgi:malic enzyme
MLAPSTRSRAPLSGACVVPPTALARMNRDPIAFAIANPDPEVSPEEAAPYVRVMATGRSDYPDQINNVLCFPGCSAAPSTCARLRSPRR